MAVLMKPVTAPLTAADERSRAAAIQITMAPLDAPIKNSNIRSAMSGKAGVYSRTSQPARDNMAAAVIGIRRRPNLSDSQPPAGAPTAQPTSINEFDPAAAIRSRSYNRIWCITPQSPA